MLRYLLLSCLIACALACHPSSNPETPRFEVHHEPVADIWLGELEFVNLFCGTGSIMPSIFTNTLETVQNTFRGLLKRSAGDPAEITPEDLSAEELNRYKLDHSFMYFRGHAYEWGAGMFLRSFINGTVNRDPTQCSPNAITWTLQGNSTCTLDQVKAMAYSYHQAYGQYALLTNNCHIFVERLMQKLRDGQCEPFNLRGTGTARMP